MHTHNYTMNLLIVEDEYSILRELADFFKSEHYTVEAVDTFNAAEQKLAVYTYDCMIVDLMLPDGDGLDLIRQVKQRNLPMSVIVISAKGSTEEKIDGLDSGADDYLAKPFSLAELNSRLRAVIRRRCFGGLQELVVGKMRIYPDGRRVFVGKNELPLTPKEFDLLLYFVTNKGRVLSKESIVEHLWGDSMGITADSFDFIYTHIRNMRHKMDQFGIGSYIRTIYSVGYKFVGETR